MKKIITLIGPNGVGKSTAAALLLQHCPRSAYVDADWCRMINPFPFTQATKRTVEENIFCLFRNYLICEDIDRIIFPYGFHGERKEIFDSVIEHLRAENLSFRLHLILLSCCLEENLRRAAADQREEERIRRGIVNTFHFYDDYSCPSIDTTHLTPEQTVKKILELTEDDEPSP